MILSNTTSFVIAGCERGDALSPAIALADELAAQHAAARVILAGLDRADSHPLIADCGHEYRPISVGRRGLFHGIASGNNGVCDARRLLAIVRAMAVISFGGESGQALGHAAVAAGLPLIVFVPTASPLPDAKELAMRASLVFAAFPGVRDELLARCPVRVTGMPVRRHVFPPQRLAQRSHGNGKRAQRLLVLATSAECHQINAFLPETFDMLRADLASWRIIHRTRRDEVHLLKQAYGRLRLNAVATAYIHKFPQFLAGADLVITEAEGMKIGELVATSPATVIASSACPSQPCGGSLLRALERHGACVVVRDCQESDDLAEQIRPLLRDRRRRGELSAALRSCFRPDAAWQMARMIREVVPQHETRLV